VRTGSTPEARAGAPEAGWAWPYRTGAAVVSVLLIPVAVLAHLLWPPPWAPGVDGPAAASTAGTPRATADRQPPPPRLTDRGAALTAVVALTDRSRPATAAATCAA
jgi:hypothetical protein